MNETQRRRIGAYIMAIDFEKYFDMVEHQAIQGSLEITFVAGSAYFLMILKCVLRAMVSYQNGY